MQSLRRALATVGCSCAEASGRTRQREALIDMHDTTSTARCRPSYARRGEGADGVRGDPSAGHR